MELICIDLPLRGLAAKLGWDFQKNAWIATARSTEIRNDERLLFGFEIFEYHLDDLVGFSTDLFLNIIPNVIS